MILVDKKQFNNVILSNLIITEGFDSFGYPSPVKPKTLTPTVENTVEIHTNYYSPFAFHTFLQEMKKEHKAAYNAYNSGSGQELTPQAFAPPKMASIASSSRFCYLALRKNTIALGGTSKAIFEARCPIAGVKNATANLDAHIKDDNVNIYVEAKCQEIFDNHKHEMRIPYWDCIYGNINRIGFNLKTTEPKPVDTGKNHFDIPMGMLGLNDIKRFDFKQFLCHLLGIASQNKKENKAATLCYMFFKPLSNDPEIQSSIDDIFEQLKTEIQAVFNNGYIQAFCKNNNITLTAIAEEAKTMESLTASNKIILFPDPLSKP